MTDTAIAELAPAGGRTRGLRGPSARRRPATTGGTGRARRRSGRTPIRHRDRHQPRALSEAERQAILERAAQRPVRRRLTDRGVGHAARRRASTWARSRRSTGCCVRPGESRERRRQATHPAKVKPELVATEPNQVWSWDITKLRGPAKWTYYYLYVILDIYSRYVVGWMVATRESAALAEVLIRQTCAKQGIGARPVDHPRRPRLLDDLQAGGVPARRSRRHPVPQPTPRLRRQPVQRGPVWTVPDLVDTRS